MKVDKGEFAAELESVGDYTNDQVTARFEVEA